MISSLPQLVLAHQFDLEKPGDFKAVWKGTVSTNALTEGFGLFVPDSSEAKGTIQNRGYGHSDLDNPLPENFFGPHPFKIDFLHTAGRREEWNTEFIIEAIFRSRTCAALLFRPETGGKNWCSVNIHYTWISSI